jgi:hypothetical protein
LCGQCFGTKFAEKNRETQSLKNRDEKFENSVHILKLLTLSIVAANAGYTLFLLPVLGIVYPDKGPLILVNTIASAAINSLAGILLGLFTQ